MFVRKADWLTNGCTLSRSTNYIYLLLRNRKVLCYSYENTVEIDFYTEDKILIEAKFYSHLTEKQEKLFSEYPADKK